MKWVTMILVMWAFQITPHCVVLKERKKVDCDQYLACCEGASVIHCDVYLDDIPFKMYLPEKLNFNLFRAGSQT